MPFCAWRFALFIIVDHLPCSGKYILPGKSRLSSRSSSWVPTAVDRAAVHDHDPVRVLHGGDALSDDDLGGFRDILRAAPCGSVRRSWYPPRWWNRPESGSWASSAARGRCKAAASGRRTRWCRPVRYGYRIRPGTADKLIRLRQAAGLLQFLIGGVLVAPAQVFLDGAGKQHVFLQHHCYLVAQRFQVVVSARPRRRPAQRPRWRRTAGRSAGSARIWKNRCRR